MPGKPASTKLTWVFGSAPKSVAAPLNSLALLVTWAWTSRPTTISQGPVRPSSVKDMASFLVCPGEDARLLVGQECGGVAAHDAPATLRRAGEADQRPAAHGAMRDAFLVHHDGREQRPAPLRRPGAEREEMRVHPPPRRLPGQAAGRGDGAVAEEAPRLGRRADGGEAAPAVERRLGHAPARSAGTARKPAAVSIADPTAKTVSSSKARPIPCRPSGGPCPSSPAGTARPGSPARFAVTVKTSFRYIVTGSSCFSSIPKAAEGVAGVTMASTFWNASSKSRLISARIFCAFK